jgi:hypothetical protein
MDVDDATGVLADAEQTALHADIASLQVNFNKALWGNKCIHSVPGASMQIERLRLAHVTAFDMCSGHGLQQSEGQGGVGGVQLQHGPCHRMAGVQLRVRGAPAVAAPAQAIFSRTSLDSRDGSRTIHGCTFWLVF